LHQVTLPIFEFRFGFFLDLKKFLSNTLSLIFFFIDIVLIFFLGICYRVDNWNWLNVLIVIFSVIDQLFDSFDFKTIFIVGRIFRLFRLLKFAKGLKALATSIIFNFAQLLNVIILMFIVCFAFAIIGVANFGSLNVEKTYYMDNAHINFKDFPTALLFVFVLSTGENWPGIMNDCMIQSPQCDPSLGECGYTWAPIYFIALQVIFNWILLNSFIAITIDTFHEMITNNAEVKEVERTIAEFNSVWATFDRKGKYKIYFPDMIPLYERIVFPTSSEIIPTRKPPIQQAFKNIKIYNNKVLYFDVLRELLYLWFREGLPPELVQKLKLRQLHKIKKVHVFPFGAGLSVLNIQRVYRGYRHRKDIDDILGSAHALENPAALVRLTLKRRAATKSNKSLDSLSSENNSNLGSIHLGLKIAATIAEAPSGLDSSQPMNRSGSLSHISNSNEQSNVAHLKAENTHTRFLTPRSEPELSKSQSFHEHGHGQNNLSSDPGALNASETHRNLSDDIKMNSSDQQLRFIEKSEEILNDTLATPKLSDRKNRISINNQIRAIPTLSIEDNDNKI